METEYEKWLDDCLAEYNSRYGEKRRFHTDWDGLVNPEDLVEFSEDGDAYPHSAFGTNYLKRVVTPWTESRHFRE